MNWVRRHARGASAEEARRWKELVTPLSIGLILRNINTIFKFVSSTHPVLISGHPDEALSLTRSSLSLC